MLNNLEYFLLKVINTTTVNTQIVIGKNLGLKFSIALTVHFYWHSDYFFRSEPRIMIYMHTKTVLEHDRTRNSLLDR